MAGHRQGADFVHLYRRHGVRVQTGGSDQWGNITAGATHPLPHPASALLCSGPLVSTRQRRGCV